MKVFLDTIGCRLNQSEIERMALQFRAAGHEVVDSPAGADLVVVALGAGPRAAELAAWAALGSARAQAGVYQHEVALAQLFARPGAWR